MSSLTWKEHFKDRLEGLEESPESPLLDLALSEGRFTEEEYLQWVSETHQIPMLESRFFLETPPSTELIEKFKHSWSATLMPVNEWDGILVVAGFEPKTDLPKGAVFVLAAKSAMAGWWEQVAPAAAQAEDLNNISIEVAAPTGISFAGISVKPKDEVGVVAEETKPVISDVVTTTKSKIEKLVVEPPPTHALTEDTVVPISAKAKPSIPSAPVPKIPAANEFSLKIPSAPNAQKEPDALTSPSITLNAVTKTPPPPPADAKPSVPVSATSDLSSITAIAKKPADMPAPPQSNYAFAMVSNPKIGEYGLKKFSAGRSTFTHEVTTSLKAASSVFNKAMLLMITENGESLLAHSWTTAFDQGHHPKPLPTAIASPFRIVATTEKPFHGLVSPCEPAKAFSASWLGGGELQHLTIVPIFRQEKLVAVLLGVGGAEAAPSATLKAMEKIARDLSNAWDGSIQKAA